MKLKVALPKGRLWDETARLLETSGIHMQVTHRDYRPKCNIDYVEFYVMKPRNIPKMVESGKIDIGIIGLDLVEDEKAKVDLMLDLKLMPVFIVMAGKKHPVHAQKSKIFVATEYVNISKRYLRAQRKKTGIDFEIIKTYGSTECFAPEFADIIIDHTQTGETLRKNNLNVHDIIMRSTAYLIASKKMSGEAQEYASEVSRMLKAGIEKMDLRYPGFLSEEEIRKI